VPAPPQGARDGRRLAISCLMVILAGVFFRFYHLDHKVYWEDETNGAIRTAGYTEAEIVAAAPSISSAAQMQTYFRLPEGSAKTDRLADTVLSLAREDPQHPPLHYVLAHLWERIFGTTAAAVRSLPALFGVVSIACVYWFALELFEDRRVAWIASALVAVSPFFVLYSQEAREYSLWTACVASMCALFLRARRLMKIEAWALYAASVAIALYVYPFSALVAISFGLYLVATEKPRLGRPLASYVISCSVALALFVPWLQRMRASAGVGRGMNGILSLKLSKLGILLTFLRDVRSSFFDLGFFRFGFVRSTPVNFALTAATTILVAGAFAFVIRRKPLRIWSLIALVAAVSALSLVMHDLIFGGGLVYQARYFMPLYLCAELSVAAWIASAMFSERSSRRSRALGASLSVVLLLGGVLSCAISAAADTWASKDSERDPAVAAIVNRSIRPVIVSDFDTSRILSLSYYLDPSVELRLNLHCDQCDLPFTERSDLLRAIPLHRAVFLLAPSEGLIRQARERGASFQIINGETYPRVPDALNLFAPP